MNSAKYSQPCAQARENKGVKEAFSTLIREILARNPEAGTGEDVAEVLGANEPDP